MSASGTKVKIVWSSSSGRWRAGGTAALLFKETLSCGCGCGDGGCDGGDDGNSCEYINLVLAIGAGELPEAKLPSMQSCRLAMVGIGMPKCVMYDV